MLLDQMATAASLTWIWDLRRVPKVGSLTGRSTISLLLASTWLFRPESTVPTSCAVQPAMRSFSVPTSTCVHCYALPAIFGISR